MVPTENSNEETTAVGDNRPPSETVVQMIADAEDAAPIDLSPLYGAIDPNALDALFQGRAFESVMFNYGGSTVMVQRNGEVTVQT